MMVLLIKILINVCGCSDVDEAKVGDSSDEKYGVGRPVMAVN